jgi:enterochelin esterase-like enzyme
MHTRWTAIAFLLLTATALLLASQPALSQNQTSAVVESSGSDASSHRSELISQFEHSLGLRDQHSVTRFWTTVHERGTPLVEPIISDPNHYLVTFLWQGRKPLRNVLLISGLSNSSYSSDTLRGNMLIRVPKTDVWYRTYRVRSDARFTYSFSPDDSLIPSEEEQSPEIREAKFLPDPLNQRHIGDAKSESLVELPAAPRQEWFLPRQGVPKGTIVTTRYRSTILKNEREITVYTPPDYESSGMPYRLLILMDGEAYTSDIPVPTILDNLKAANRIPPLVAVFIDNVSAGQPAVRTTELSCYGPFSRFLSDELLPWIHQRYRVTAQPSQTILGGVSRGGTAALCASLEYPAHFGNVLTESGFFVFKDRNWFKNASPAEAPDLESQIEMGWEQYGLLMQRIAGMPKLQLRFAMDVGKFENDFHPSPLIANRHLRDVLTAKGYALKYQEFAGHHSPANWRGTFPDALLYLLGN